MNSDKEAPPAAPHRLEWPDDTETSARPPTELRALQREFWTRLTPGIFDTHCVAYPQQALDWD